MADLGAIGSGPTGGFWQTNNIRTASNPDPTYLAKKAVYDKFHASAFEWQTSPAAPTLNTVDNTGTITGTVFLDGVPLANQVISLYHRATGQYLKDTVSGTDGGFQFDGLETAANVYFLVTIYGTTAKSLNINFQAPSFISIGLFTMALRRPLVLINGIITEAPDGTTYVGVPTALVKYSANVGDGSNVTHTVTHNLNSRDVTVEVRDNNSPYDVVDVQWGATTVNSITLTFDTAPSTNRYRVTVIS